MQDDIQKDLPWLVNGTLSAEERTRLEAALGTSDQARAALNWELALRKEIKAETTEWTPPPQALNEVMKRIARSQAQARPSAIRDFLARVKESFQITPKFAFACAVMVVQVGVIGYLWSSLEQERGYSEMRSTQPYNSTTKFIRVMFKPTSTESDLRDLLHNVNAEIVAGPSQVGDYYLLVEPVQLSSALAALKANAKIEAAEIVNALPAKP